MHQKNSISIYCFLVPSFNALLLNRSMHFNSHHVFQFSPCVFCPQYSVPTQLSPELWGADLTSANRAAGREQQLNSRGQQSCVRRGWGIFLVQKYYRWTNHPQWRVTGHSPAHSVWPPQYLPSFPLLLQARVGTQEQTGFVLNRVTESNFNSRMLAFYTVLFACQSLSLP